MPEIKDVLGVVGKLNLEPVLTPVLGLVDGAMGILNSLAGPGALKSVLGGVENIPLRKMIPRSQSLPMLAPTMSALSRFGLVDMVFGVFRSEYVVKTINFIIELLGRILSPISSLVQRLISVIKPLMSAIGRHRGSMI